MKIYRYSNGNPLYLWLSKYSSNPPFAVIHFDKSITVIKKGESLCLLTFLDSKVSERVMVAAIKREFGNIPIASRARK